MEKEKIVDLINGLTYGELMGILDTIDRMRELKKLFGVNTYEDLEIIAEILEEKLEKEEEKIVEELRKIFLS